MKISSLAFLLCLGMASFQAHAEMSMSIIDENGYQMPFDVPEGLMEASTLVKAKEIIAQTVGRHASEFEVRADVNGKPVKLETDQDWLDTKADFDRNERVKFHVIEKSEQTK